MKETWQLWCDQTGGLLLRKSGVAAVAALKIVIENL
jgi:hypothetical protein